VLPQAATPVHAIAAAATVTSRRLDLLMNMMLSS
jgi:hypothetical protein